MTQTRQKTTMEEAVKALMEEQRRWIQQQISEQNQRIEAQQEQMMTKLLNQLQIQDEKTQHHNVRSDNYAGFRNNLHFNPKIEFLTFDGTSPKGWIKKCTRYFSLCRINDEQKVDLTALHLKGPVEMWFGSYILGRRCAPGLEMTCIAK